MRELTGRWRIGPNAKSGLFSSKQTFSIEVEIRYIHDEYLGGYIDSEARIRWFSAKYTDLQTLGLTGVNDVNGVTQ